MKSCILITLFALIFNLAFAQTSWVKYTNNPVLPRDTTHFPPSNDLIASSDPFVIKTGTTYKMWYTCGGGNYPADTLLRARICYCTSNDGMSWVKHSNPVIDVSYNGSWDSLGVETITVIIDSSAPTSQRYKAWYAGQYFNDYRYDIGYAWSADGINWLKHGSPVLSVGNSTDWDNGFLEGPSVIKDGGIYKMWYAGYDVVVDGQSTDGKVNIGYATSTDGISWTKYIGNPVMTTSASGWDLLYVQDPHIIKKDGIYHLWFGGTDTELTGGYGQQTGYAYSSDGINWTKSIQNPILKKGNAGEWDFNLASFPSVIFDDDGTLKMWYTARDKDSLPNNLNYFWEIGLATDSSGYSFIYENITETGLKIYPNPALDHISINFSENLSLKHLIIYDYIGRNKKEIDIRQNTEIDISELPSGIYFIRINERSCNSKRFIKL